MKKLLALCLVLVLWTVPARCIGQVMGSDEAPAAVDRVNELDRTQLPSSVTPMAAEALDLGRSDPDSTIRYASIGIAVRPGAQAELDDLLEQQQYPKSSLYHAWLTPDEFGERFGVDLEDLRVVSAWLAGHGLAVDPPSRGRTWITFSGSVTQIEEAFQTQIHDYERDGEHHYANIRLASVPRALASLVTAVRLHDFGPKSFGRMRSEYTSPNGSHSLAPGDFATIYNLSPIYAAGYDGSGINIAIVGRSDINISDVQAFRSEHGLAAKDPVIIHPHDPPGLVADDEGEAALDVEWAGAVGRGSTVYLVATPNSEGGILDAATYIVNQNFASIMSISFGLCESKELGVINATSLILQQAASQGISVLVSSGDAGAAGCDAAKSAMASLGQGVNYLCTPSVTCVGGTMFNEGSGGYWSASNNPTTLASALSYIPEVAWNESTSGGLWSSGGGRSLVFPKPGWQVGAGVPADGVRDEPDIALSASSHDGYQVVLDGQRVIYSGTSAAAPAFAGIAALLREYEAGRLGNLNPRLYQLGAAQYAGTGPAVFHDVISGNNSVPGQAGFGAGPGYDLVTGLGSVDATAFLNAWATSAAAPVASFSFSPPSPVVGQAVSFADTSTGAPTSWSWTFGDGTTSTAQNPAKSFATAGNYAVSLTASNGFGSSSSSHMVTVGPATLANLTPYQPSSWSGPIVVARAPSQLVDSTGLLPTDTLYVSWAVTNAGSGPTQVRFSTELYVDGVLRKTWGSDPPLNQNFYAYVNDFSIGSLPAGAHTLRIKADSTNLIAESNEADNEYTKTISVQGTAPPSTCTDSRALKTTCKPKVVPFH